MSQQYRYPQSASVTANIPAVGVNGDPIPAESILIGAENPSGDLTPLQADVSGNLLVASSPVGTGDVNLVEIVGSAPSATNPLPARLSDGTSFYQGATESTAQSILTEVSDTTVNTAGIITAVNDFAAKSAGALVPEAFDYQAITYVSGGAADGQIDTVTYKSGGSGGTTVATLTMAYDVGTGKLTSVTKT